MASVDTERLIFLLEANTRALEAGMLRAERKSRASMAAMERRANEMEARLTRSFKRGGDALAGLIPAVSVGAIIAATGGVAALADAYTALQNQTKIYTASQEDATRATQFVLQTAIDARVPLGELTKVFAGASRAAKDFGSAAAEVETLTEVIAKAAATANSGPQALAGALTQLAQALPAARVEAEEFNSVIDGAFGVAQAAANGIEAAGGSVSKLQTLVRDGQISGSALMRALLSQITQVREAFLEATPTIAGSAEALKTALIRAIGGVDDTAAATENISKFILGMANNIDDAANAARVFIGEFAKIAPTVATVASLGAAVFAVTQVFRALMALRVVVFLSQGAAAAGTFAVANGVLAASATALVASLRGLTAASAAFIATPLGAALVAVGIAASIAAANTMKHAKEVEEARKAVAEAEQALTEYEQAAVAAANSDGEAAKRANELADAARRKAIQVRDSAAAAREAAIASAELARQEAAAAAATAGRAVARANEAQRTGALEDLASLTRSPLENLTAQRRATAAVQEAAAANQAWRESMEAVAAAQRNYERAVQAVRIGDETRAGRGVVAQDAPGRTGGADSEQRKAEAAAKKAKREAEAAARKAEREAEQAARKAARDAEQAAIRRRERQRLDIEHEIELGRLRGLNTDALEDQVAVMALAEQLSGSQLPNEQAIATATARIAELRKLSNELRKEEIDEIAKVLELDEARARGDGPRVRQLEDELEVRRRTAEYVQLGLNKEEAIRKATQDTARAREAIGQGAQRDVRQREDELRIEILKAQQAFEQAEQAERELFIERRTAELAANGLLNARELATIEADMAETARKTLRTREEQADAIQRQIDLLRRRNLGDSPAARSAERQQRVDATADGIAERSGRNRNDPAVVAEARLRVDQEDLADFEGRLRQVNRDAWRAAVSGDFEDFLTGVLRRAFEKAMDNAADALFDLVSSLLKNGSGNNANSNGTINTVANVLSTFFGGRRETGGAVRRGRAYVVGENGPELFSPGQSGNILPGAVTAGGTRSVTIYVNAKDALLTSQLRAEMAQATAAGIAAAFGEKERQSAFSSRYRTRG